MKKLLLIVLLTLSCGEEPQPEDTRTECQKALEHIKVCIGYRPYLPNCNDSRAETILSTPCENIKELWR
jgi:hypothetical protein